MGLMGCGGLWLPLAGSDRPRRALVSPGDLRRVFVGINEL
jgi:hypothetical protein